MDSIQARLQQVQEQIRNAAEQAGRQGDKIELLAVSKTRPVPDIEAAMAAGQVAFGENYLQDALSKIEALRDSSAQWHFIGRIQSNKTRPIAENFDWVHSLDSIKHAQRLNDQRPEQLTALNICLQVNIDQQASKGGLTPEQLPEAIDKIQAMPRLKLRGLMVIPAPATELEAQRQPFSQLRQLRDNLATPELPLETLSMGMSGDLTAAIMEGATIVRIGTAIFGPRPPMNRTSNNA
ncbi:MAG: YggS family pyridoxal phosphate-dependent enzyme [Chromatiales bacterium]|nr:YggS family pyridoxal phosphate-dependent enzyme [Chromatiales bacterium]